MEVDGISSESSSNTIDDIDSSDDDGSSTNSDGPSSVLMHFNESSTSSPMLPRELFRGESENMEQEQEQPEQDGVREEMGEQQEEEGGNQLQGKEEEVHQSEQQEVQHVLQQQMEDMQIEQSSVKQDGDSSSSSSSGSDEEDRSSSDEQSDIDMDDGLSDYERLRLRNIRRNEARLAQLGLLTKVTTSNSVAGGTSQRSSNGSSAMTELLTSNPNQKQPKRRRQAAPVPRRSLPHRRAKIKRFSIGSDEEDGYSSDESSQASPIKILKILRPQPHQELKKEEEQGLKHYRKTRRVRRGRPKREEYLYSCNEVCKGCSGGWQFDNDTDADKENRVNEGGGGDYEDLEEKTRLIRCKDCRGAFHLSCMMVHGKKRDVNDGQDGQDENAMDIEDRKPATIAVFDTSDSAADEDDETEEAFTRDPKRCYQCEAKYKLQQQQSSSEASSSKSSGILYLLEATVDDRTIGVRVTPEPALGASLDGIDITCYVTLGDQTSSGYCISSTDKFTGGGGQDEKRVKWNSPLEEYQQTDKTTLQVQKLINKALSDGDHSRLQDYACAELRKHLTSKESVAKVVNLGGINMLTNAMERHRERPIIQAEALCTLAAIVWADPTEFGMETINADSLGLALTAMERHGVHSKVLQMGCGYFRALSYDATCCTKMRRMKAVECVVESIMRNPRKVNVMMEGSMFLQNMMVVSPSITIKPMLKSKQRNDSSPSLLPTLFSSAQTNSSNVDLLYAVLGLLGNVALNPMGKSALCSLNVNTLAMDTIRDHPNNPELHEIALALLQNTVNLEENNDEK